ncbi:MAG: 5-methyltetrahydropteroyltriglutamate--homocysteine S-methyltransferase [Syntrophorhabdaceae bacterium]|nr:5-methyltetrahydropteroyltriglutamate--homocysteine S-methyltransferase [Syntrophorhabdaceae bacterium]
MKTYAYGFPRLGMNREYKTVIESYWAGRIKEEKLMREIENLERKILHTYKANVDNFPVGEMTLYDKMLDTATLIGLYKTKTINDYFRLCRGKNALEMTKWFNTNYHYLIPRIKENYKPSIFKPEIERLKRLCSDYKEGLPYFIGPFTFLKLSKSANPQNFKFHLMEITDLYCDIVKEFHAVHLDEPALVLDLTEEELKLFRLAYSKIGRYNANIFLFTYYDSVDCLEELYDLPVKGIGLDFINGRDNFINIRSKGFPDDKMLFAGIVNGRNVWKTDIKKAASILKELSLHSKNIVISNGSPLYHLPVTVKGEKTPVNDKLAFAEERLGEIATLKKIMEEDGKGITILPDDAFFNNHPIEKTRLSKKFYVRSLPYSERIIKQKKALNLPLFPATTIGSFPQTPDVRQARTAYKRKEMSEGEYNSFIRKKIQATVELQEQLGLDVRVHGEYERSDMVEFFAEKLKGFATTNNGWVLSYGTRTYRPPIIFGDIERQDKMTVDFIKYAQSLTQKPVKGILTGPVTIIKWSYVRDDIPVEKIALQLALSLKAEIMDLEKEGIKIIQIDEPAFKEGAPIKKRNWDRYFSWAVNSFNLCISETKPETQVHTHMCYSEFGEIIEYIMKMDFDVISIEASRSKGDIIDAFKEKGFKKQIGLGVWDVHSYQTAKSHSMIKVIKKALSVFSPEQLWINPDCGLKTREWKETVENLKNMMKVVEVMRNSKDFLLDDGREV